MSLIKNAEWKRRGKKLVLAIAATASSFVLLVSGTMASGEMVNTKAILSVEQVSMVECEPAFQLIRPLDDGVGYISSPYARRWGSMHSGVDIAAPRGSKIYAAEDGVVTFAGWGGSYGRCVIIDHENGIQTRYAHQLRLNVSYGDRVEKGDVIGYVGTSGQSTGYHLHFEVIENGRTRNPQSYVNL